ncbi:MAG TPA: hypothetical protein VKI19_14715 [Acidimicrobiales bacterium]|nr:hypothetical protein [Acidimicrobiales bacterium]
MSHPNPELERVQAELESMVQRRLEHRFTAEDQDRWSQLVEREEQLLASAGRDGDPHERDGDPPG